MTDFTNFSPPPLVLFLDKIRPSFWVGSLAPPGLKVAARTRVKETVGPGRYHKLQSVSGKTGGPSETARSRKREKKVSRFTAAHKPQPWHEPFTAHRITLLNIMKI